MMLVCLSPPRLVISFVSQSLSVSMEPFRLGLMAMRFLISVPFSFVRIRIVLIWLLEVELGVTNSTSSRASLREIASLVGSLSVVVMLYEFFVSLNVACGATGIPICWRRCCVFDAVFSSSITSSTFLMNRSVRWDSTRGMPDVWRMFLSLTICSSLLCFSEMNAMRLFDFVSFGLSSPTYVRGGLCICWFV